MGLNALSSRLPPNFDIGRLPPSMIADISAGRPFNLRAMPSDMLDAFRKHNPDLNPAIEEALNRVASNNTIGVFTALSYDCTLLDTCAAVSVPLAERVTQPPSTWVRADQLFAQDDARAKAKRTQYDDMTRRVMTFVRMF
jgi:hypothetical protein